MDDAWIPPELNESREWTVMGSTPIAFSSICVKLNSNLRAAVLGNDGGWFIVTDQMDGKDLYRMLAEVLTYLITYDQDWIPFKDRNYYIRTLQMEDITVDEEADAHPAFYIYNHPIFGYTFDDIEEKLEQSPVLEDLQPTALDWKHIEGTPFYLGGTTPNEAIRENNPGGPQHPNGLPPGEPRVRPAWPAAVPGPVPNP